MFKSGQAIGEIRWRMDKHEQICCLSDSERHLGYILERKGEWIAFDATHTDTPPRGPRRIGVFPSVKDAQVAVEHAAGLKETPKVRTAGS